MKKLNKAISIMLGAALFAFSAIGCTRERAGTGGGEDEEKAQDSSLSQLHVMNYEGGFGRKWLDEAAKRFEEKYAETSFEEGKKGVHVNIESSKNATAGETLINALKTSDNEVFFTEDVFLYKLVASGGAADITDIVSEQDMSEFGETGSIVDKLDPTIRSFYDVDGHYYALPHYEAPKGMIYDVDLFDIKGFWMTKTGDFVKKSAVDASELSTGPDGKSGTYDDGLPRTFDEFFALLDHMVESGTTPFTASGMYKGYATSAMYQLWADIEGREQFYLNYSFDGTAKTLINEMEGDGAPVNGKYTNLMPPTAITAENGNLLQRQAGKYVALDFMKRLVSNPKYYSQDAFSPAIDHLTTQDHYLFSRLNPTTNNPYAILLEGVWWENEADETGFFSKYEKYGWGRFSDPKKPNVKARRFAMMPFPKANEDLFRKTDEEEPIVNKRTIADYCNYSCSFVNSNIKDPAKLALAKKFLKFVHSDDEMQEFTVNTSTLKPLYYAIPEEKMERMSYFGKDIAAARNNPDIDTVYTYSDAPVFVNNFSQFYVVDYSWKCGISDSEYPLYMFSKNKSLTIKTLFDSMIDARNKLWAGIQK